MLGGLHRFKRYFFRGGSLRSRGSLSIGFSSSDFAPAFFAGGRAGGLSGRRAEEPGGTGVLSGGAGFLAGGAGVLPGGAGTLGGATGVEGGLPTRSGTRMNMLSLSSATSSVSPESTSGGAGVRPRGGLTLGTLGALDER